MASVSNESSNTVLDGALLLRADLHDLAEDVAEHCSQSFAGCLRHRSAQVKRIQHLSALVCSQQAQAARRRTPLARQLQRCRGRLAAVELVLVQCLQCRGACVYLVPGNA